MPVELKERFEKVTDAVVTEGYGLTESSGVVSVNPYEGLNKSGTVGQPLPGTRIVLVDRADPDRPAPPGEPGEITFAGPSSEEHTSELQSLMRISSDVFCLTKKK